MLVLLFIAADAVYLYSIWPDWSELAQGPVPKSSFMLKYEQSQREHGRSPGLRWSPVQLQQISPLLREAVIVAEDARFYGHKGIDLEAIKEAVEHNLAQGKISLGASTISQQTVKNLFLTASRDPLRKWHELVLTLTMEHYLSKRRILELYLNIAEFGPGIYGANAAAKQYWGIHASELDDSQAIKLAATLPSPRRDNPATNTRRLMQRIEKISRHLSIKNQR